MNLPKKKIALFFCGGTTLDANNIRESTIFQEKDIKKWLSQFKEINILANIDAFFIYAGPATDISPSIWLKLAAEIKKRENDYQGFAVTSDVKSLLYTANALAFLLLGFSRPIIFTGSQIPFEWKNLPLIKNILKDKETDLGLKANLINALQLACLERNEVMIAFGTKVVCSVLAQRTGFLTLNIFDSLNRQAVLGNVDLGIKLETPRLIRGLNFKRQEAIKIALSCNIRFIKYYPGIDEKIFQDQQNLFILELGDFTNIPDFIKNYAQGLTYPLLVWQPKKDIFTVAKTDLKNNIIVFDNITKEALIVKAMWVLGQTDKPAMIRKLLLENLAGELG